MLLSCNRAAFRFPHFLGLFFGRVRCHKNILPGGKLSRDPGKRRSRGPFFLRGSLKSIFVIFFVRNHSTKDVTLQFYLLFLLEKIFGSIFGPLRAILVLFATFFAFWEITFPFFFFCSPKGDEKSGFFCFRARLTVKKPHIIRFPTLFPPLPQPSFPKDFLNGGRADGGAKKNSPFLERKVEISIFPIFSKMNGASGESYRLFFHVKNPPFGSGGTLSILSLSHTGSREEFHRANT